MSARHPSSSSALQLHRRLLWIGAAFYGVWWAAVEIVLPGSFNPVLSRFVLVALILWAWAATFFIPWFRRNVSLLFSITAWLITLHYFYLFYANGGGTDWVVGSYITVMTINLCFLSRQALVSYSLFVIFVSIICVWAIPSLGRTVFLPGIATIVLQANIGLRSRFRQIRVLAESNERFRSLFHSTFEGILVHENRRIVNVNDALARILRTTPAELLGKDVLDVIAPEHQVNILQNMSLEDTSPFETVAITPSGERIAVEVRGKTFKSGKRPSRIVTVNPIGDRKRAEREASLAQALAENVRVRDEFISIASHELKTPLTSLILQIQILERDSRKDALASYGTHRLQETFSLLHRQTARLTGLVETMLDVSRISTGRLLLDPRAMDLKSTVQQTVRHLPQACAHTLSVHADAPVAVLADPARIEQVIENLVTNAIKYGKGKPVEIHIFQENGKGCITVKDQGIGIAPEFQEKIFNRFERAISPRGIAGLGLGLYIARQIVEAHGGHVSVDSSVGVGSTFKVELPLTSEVLRS